MDSDRSLAQVVMEMRNEIKKLESENRALRGELDQRPSGFVRAEPKIMSHAFQHKPGAEENSPQANLRWNASAPALEGQYKENIIMTVRRYSISSNIRAVARRSDNANRAESDDKSVDGSGNWNGLQEGILGNGPAVLVNLSPDEGGNFTKEKLTNRRPLQEYMHKNRAKVKTVTFLLPADDVYTDRPAPLDRLPDRSSYVTVENDS